MLVTMDSCLTRLRSDVSSVTVSVTPLLLLLLAAPVSVTLTLLDAVLL